MVFLLFVAITSCSETNDETSIILADYLQGNFEQGAVIACAGSDEEAKNILTFYYPEAGASDIRLYQTANANVDKNDFSAYSRVFLNPEPLFNGYLGKFTQDPAVERWIVVTFMLEGEIKISNPIRSKQISKPTVWNSVVTINQSVSTMPRFSWLDNAYGDNAIYFQVVSDNQNNLLSGTYTFDNWFQYYNTSNLVLNITTQAPPILQVGETYNFTLMDVSEDNWVNGIILNKTFISE
jgi:hypothetical protein